MDEQKEIKQKEIKKNNLKEIFDFIKHNQNIFIYIILLGIIIYSGIYVRTLDVPALVDASNGNLTLAQDLDPFLFLRWAREISINGSLAANDSMRYVPLGYNTANELTLPSYIIAYMHKWGIFSSVEMSAVYYPVIFFVLFLIAFFLFVRKVFCKNSACGWIAVIATGIMSVIPGLLHRTLAGVPEKEPGGLCFMFFALYFMACFFAVDNKKTWKALIFGSLAGICTGIMGLLWGGVMAMFLIGPAAMLLIFFFSDIDFKDVIFYLCWLAGFTIVLLTCTTKYGLALASPVVAGMAYFVGLIIIMKLLFRKRGYAILAVAGIVLAGIIILNPHFNGKTFWNYLATDAYNLIITPFSTNRLAITVAENQLAYVSTWIAEFGSAMFMAFLISIVFIGFAIFKNKLAASGFIVFALGMIFSKYSPDNSSNIIFFASMGYFIATLVIFFIKKGKIEDKNMLLFAASLLFAIFCGRSAIRLFYYIYPFVPICVAWTFVRAIQMFGEIKQIGDNEKSKKELMNFAACIIAGCLLFAIPFSLYSYNNSITNEARYSGTNYYYAQWQYAMSWVRDNTPANSVFAHWWDYGYWVQTIGQRATILDGGNAISYWDYLMGRALTQDISNETFAFEFYKAHNADYLLIDSTDIGKYTAYSSIGSDKNYDRISMIQPFVINQKLEQETRNETIEFYPGGGQLEDDYIAAGSEAGGNGGNILPAGTPIIGIMQPFDTATKEFHQPSIIAYSQNRNIYIPVSCVYISDNMIIFEELGGIEGCVYYMPLITDSSIIPNGAALWLSPRLMKSTMVNIYILGKDIPGYELVHSEPNTIISSISKSYPDNVQDISYVSGIGVAGPIKIWRFNYSAYPEIESAKTSSLSGYLATVFPETNLR